KYSRHSKKICLPVQNFCHSRKNYRHCKKKAGHRNNETRHSKKNSRHRTRHNSHNFGATSTTQAQPPRLLSNKVQPFRRCLVLLTQLIDPHSCIYRCVKTA
ncbi:unnamed protein product, partial [Amoebophrya sp. A25]